MSIYTYSWRGLEGKDHTSGDDDHLTSCHSPEYSDVMSL